MGKKQSGPGNKKEESLEMHSEAEELTENIEISDNYLNGEDQLGTTAGVRHPNRKTSKKQRQDKGKENKNESVRQKSETDTEERPRTIAEELPGKITKEVIAELAAYKSSCCISLYLPTHQAGSTDNEGFDALNFKNALQEIEIILKAKQVSQSTIQFMVEPAYALLKQDDFWPRLSKGLAVFLDDGYFKYINLPESPSMKIVCEPTFYLTPLVPMLSTKEYFYLLVISKQQVKLFKADAFGIEHVPVEGLPEGGLDEVKRLSDKDATTWRTGGRGGTGGANFHGIGGGNADDKTNIATYFEVVDDILFKQILNRENAPLLLAGVEYLIPIYKSVCDYHNVWIEALTGSYEHEETNSLYEQAIKLMQPFFNERKMKALNVYGNRSATQLTSSNVSEVVSASYYGRVSHLFVLKGAHVWGTYDEMTTEFKFHPTPDEGADDLIDNAVEKTLMTGGEVFVLDKEEMPAESEVAAVFRY